VERLEVDVFGCCVIVRLALGDWLALPKREEGLDFRDRKRAILSCLAWYRRISGPFEARASFSAEYGVPGSCFSVEALRSYKLPFGLNWIWADIDWHLYT